MPLRFRAQRGRSNPLEDLALFVAEPWLALGGLTVGGVLVAFFALILQPWRKEGREWR
jgi:hypothetical protein